MPTPNLSDDAWAPCPAGELSHLAARLDAHGRIRRSKAAITRGVVLLLLVGAGLLVFSASGAGSISCEQCHSHFAEYHRHQTGQQLIADAGLVASIKDHLEHCEHCRRDFAAAYPDVSLDSASGSPHSTGVARRGISEEHAVETRRHANSQGSAYLSGRA